METLKQVIKEVAVFTNTLINKKEIPFVESSNERKGVISNALALVWVDIKDIGTFRQAIRTFKDINNEAELVAQFPKMEIVNKKPVHKDCIKTYQGRALVEKVSSYGKGAIRITQLHNNPQMIDGCKVTRFTVEQIIVRPVNENVDLHDYIHNVMGTGSETREAHGIVKTKTFPEGTASGLQFELKPVMPRT